MTRTHALLTACALAAAASLACAGPAAAFSGRGAAEVRPGMSEARVIALVGPPHVRLKYRDQVLLCWQGERRRSLFGRRRPVALALVFSARGRLLRPIVDFRPSAAA